jgi:hypothetical protein
VSASVYALLAVLFITVMMLAMATLIARFIVPNSVREDENE